MILRRALLILLLSAAPLLSSGCAHDLDRGPADAARTGPVGAAVIPSISGIAAIGTDSFLVVHDTKEGSDPRCGIITLGDGAAPAYHAGAFPQET